MTNAHILVVDDEPAMRELLNISLLQQGYAVSTADSASEALRLAHEEKLDLVLLDLTLPDATGLELLDMLTTANPELPVIVLSGQPRDEDMVQEIRDKGARDYLSKTQSLEQILTRVERFLNYG